MEADDLQLAIAYADLPASLAWQDFMRFQRTECERLELAALNAPASEPELARSAIIAWQQRRLVIRTMEEAVRDAASALKSAQEEIQDARPDRTDRSSW